MKNLGIKAILGHQKYLLFTSKYVQGITVPSTNDAPKNSCDVLVRCWETTIFFTVARCQNETVLVVSKPLSVVAVSCGFGSWSQELHSQ